jgi:hypothetical protein
LLLGAAADKKNQTKDAKILTPFFAQFLLVQMSFLRTEDLGGAGDPIFTYPNILNKFPVIFRNAAPKLVALTTDISSPSAIIRCSCSTVRETASRRNYGLKTGVRLVKHARYYWLLLAGGQLTRRLFGSML